MRRRLWLVGLGALPWLAACRGAGEREAAAAPAAPPDEVCIVAPTQAYDPASGLPPEAPRAVPEQARCPVCGMFPARHPRWAAQAIFDDGAVQYLDSPLSLFLYLQRVARYAPGRSEAQLRAVYVSDWAGGGWVALERAVFVAGSRQAGPMRAGNLPAFADAAQAREFARREGGRLMDAAALRRELPAELRALAPHRH